MSLDGHLARHVLYRQNWVVELLGSYIAGVLGGVTVWLITRWLGRDPKPDLHVFAFDVREHSPGPGYGKIIGMVRVINTGGAAMGWGLQLRPPEGKSRVGFVTYSGLVRSLWRSESLIPHVPEEMGPVEIELYPEEDPLKFTLEAMPPMNSKDRVISIVVSYKEGSPRVHLWREAS